jgi:hypothetical protein
LPHRLIRRAVLVVSGGEVAEGADHAEGREVDADRFESGLAQGAQRSGDHVAAGGDDDHVDLRRAVLDAGRAADHPVIEGGVLERHRQLLLGGEADRRVELLRVLDRGQPDRADDDPLVGDPESDFPRQLVGVEQLPQRRGDAVGVAHLAVLEGARR